MKRVTFVGVVVSGWLLAMGCKHDAAPNGFGGNATTGTDTTITDSTGPCLTSADCPKDGQYYCHLPEDTCPTCFWQTPACTTNADCATGKLCGPCKTCVTSCAAGPSCPTDQTCSSTSMLCVPKCQAATDCAANFDCVQGGCERKACSADSDCKGFCAGGVCVAQRGTCVECT